MKIVGFSITAFVLFFQGCFPLRYVASPGLNGRVIEKYSKTPIEGAQVFFKEYPDLKAQTKSDGGFNLQTNKKWLLIPIIGAVDLAPGHGTLIIEADGYNELEIKEMWGGDQAEIPQKEIELEKLK